MRFFRTRLVSVAITRIGSPSILRQELIRPEEHVPVALSTTTLAIPRTKMAPVWPSGPAPLIRVGPVRGGRSIMRRPGCFPAKISTGSGRFRAAVSAAASIPVWSS